MPRLDLAHVLAISERMMHVKPPVCSQVGACRSAVASLQAAVPARGRVTCKVKIVGFLLLASALSLGSMPGFAASKAGLKIGVLEDLPGHYADQSNFRGVRVVFQKEGRKWRPYPSDCSDQKCLKRVGSRYPKSVTWNIGLSGKRLGQVTGQTPMDFEFYGDVGLQKLAANAPIPMVGKRSTEYAGFNGSPVFRPLIASSQSHFADPDAWKASPLSQGSVRALRRQFREIFPKVSNCVNLEQNRLAPWRYTNADIRLIKSYVAKTGRAFAQLALADYRCDGPPSGGFISQSFAISPKGQVTLLDAGLIFLDAGDYDHSGRSSVIFSIDRYNRGGYVIYYDDFKSRAVFQFSYH